MNRREFVSAVALGGSLAAAAAPGARPKIGSVSWNFHSLEPGAHPEEAIDIIGSLGFDGIELIANSRRDVDEYWTDATIDRIRRQLERNHLVVPQFPMFQPVVENLTSRNPDERKKSLDYFEAGCRIGKKLGAPMVNIVAPWARELSASGEYLPRYFLDNPKPGEKFHIEIATGYDPQALWENFVGTMRACLERAKAHGLRFSIENHTYTMMPVTDSFLRLYDSIRDPALGCNLDCGWAMNQRDYPPVAIRKLNRRLMNLHVRDIDATMREYVPIGEGVMNFRDITDAVNAVGFEGFLTLEQDSYPGHDMKEICRRYVTMMRGLLG
ncbi:MAG TPA: sugar phosphate isomerase/epimerase family protein [Bryobacteraceae bacterium]|nr:sugar phosphate isomerase/epimerase family protein [Bryobacteraceae bacterium]